MTEHEHGEEVFNYWKKLEHAATVETMMLNPGAKSIDESDKKDVMGGFPPGLNAMRVLELGAGIGRFTEPLAERARHVHATDFIESFIETNRSINASRYPNTSYACSNCVEMECAPNSYEFVFTNWLLMYLSDHQVVDFLRNVCSWVTPGGYFHMRESCTESSTRNKSTDKSENPTNYRHISQYLELLNNVVVEDNGKFWRLEPVWSQPTKTYIMNKHNWRQCQVLVQKVEYVPTADVPEWSIEQDASQLLTTLVKAAPRQTNIDKSIAKELMIIADGSDEMKLIEELSLIERPFHDRLTVLNLSPLRVNPFSLANTTDCKVLSLCQDPFVYAAFLNLAVMRQDTRVFFIYSQFQPKHWIPRDIDVVVGLENLARDTTEDVSDIISCLKTSLRPAGKFIFLEKPSAEVWEQLYGSNCVVSDSDDLSSASSTASHSTTSLDATSSDTDSPTKSSPPR